MAVIEIYHKMSIGIHNIIKIIKYNAVFHICLKSKVCVPPKFKLDKVR